MEQRNAIMKGYMEFELLQGRTPHSVFELTSKLELEEAEFYTHFSSLDMLRKAIVSGYLTTTNALLDADENYETFSPREKMLALFFTLFEQFGQHRSYLLARYGELRKAPEHSRDWMDFLRKLNERVDLILNEAKAEGEIQDRPLIGAHYQKGYSLVFAYLFRVWVNDESAGFTTTDAAIEKTINLSIDMLGSSPMDALIDFGKFAFKTKIF